VAPSFPLQHQLRAFPEGQIVNPGDCAAEGHTVMIMMMMMMMMMLPHLLHAHLLRHDDDTAIALHRRRQCQSDTYARHREKEEEEEEEEEEAPTTHSVLQETSRNSTQCIIALQTSGIVVNGNRNQLKLKNC